MSDVPDEFLMEATRILGDVRNSTFNPSSIIARALQSTRAEGRLAGIEEAAKVATSLACPQGYPSIDYDQACHDAAQAIRALKEKAGDTAIERAGGI